MSQYSAWDGQAIVTRIEVRVTESLKGGVAEGHTITIFQHGGVADGLAMRVVGAPEIHTGDEVVVFCPEGCPEEYMGARLIGVPAMPLPLYPELKLALPRPAVSDAIDAFQPDLIHVVNPAVLGLGGIWLAKNKGIPLVASYHTHLPK